MKKDGFIAYVILYVDDMFVFTNSLSFKAYFLRTMRKWYEVKDLGSLSFALGMNITRIDKGFLLDQRKLIKKIADEFIPKYTRHTTYSPSAGDHPPKFALREIEEEGKRKTKLIGKFKEVGAKRPLGMLLYVALVRDPILPGS